MKHHHRRFAILLPLLAALALIGAGTGGLGLRNDGIQFPDGSVLSSAAGSTANVVMVAKSGGHFTSIQEALDSITNASEENPYLVWVAPGTYQERVTMKEWVGIQGAGEGITRIRVGGYGDQDISGPAVYGANHAELRDLSVEHLGQGAFESAILNLEASPRLTRISATTRATEHGIAVMNISSSPTMTQVRAASLDGATCIAILNDHSSPKMTGVVAEAHNCVLNRAIVNAGQSSPKMVDVVASAAGGAQSWAVHSRDSSSPSMLHLTAEAFGSGQNLSLYVDGYSSVQVRQSILRGDVHITNESFGAIAHSQVVGDVVADYESCACLGAYDGDLEALDEHCHGAS